MVIKAGARSAAITVQVADNGVNEDDKTVVVSMGVPTHAVAGEDDHEHDDHREHRSRARGDVHHSEPAGEGERGNGDDRGGAIGPVGQGRDRAAHGERDGKDTRKLYHHAGPGGDQGGTRSAAITVQVADNGVNEDDKTVVVSMGVPTNAVQGKTTTSTVTIVDTDPVPTVSFASASSSGEEKTVLCVWR